MAYPLGRKGKIQKVFRITFVYRNILFLCSILNEKLNVKVRF